VAVLPGHNGKSHARGGDVLAQPGGGQGAPVRDEHHFGDPESVLMKYPTESVASSNVKVRVLVRSHQRRGQWLERAGVRDALMRPVPVVELLFHSLSRNFRVGTPEVSMFMW
jgi:hypothetical protein